MSNKLMDANKKIEKLVVGGYKAIEDGVVGGYKKIEDKFVNAFLTSEETDEAAQVKSADDTKDKNEFE